MGSMNKGRTALLRLALLAGTAIPFAPAAMAQSETEAAEAGVERVVITAQRREEDIQDVPIAVTAFSDQDLVLKQIQEPLDLLQYVPNLYGGNNTGLGSANMYYIRGLGNTESIATFDPPVGTYVDEVYVARQNGNNVAFFDVEQIEVLRGPQGTLFGRNTTGGAVSVRMRKPSEELGGFLEAEVGSFDRYLLRGSVDLPASDKFLTKFSGYWLDEQGYVDNVATGETLNGDKALGMRADFRLLLSDVITWDLAAEFSKDESTNILNYDEDASVLGSSGPGGETTDGQNRISRTGMRTRRSSGTLVQQAERGDGLGLQNETLAFTSNLEWELTDDSAVNVILGYRSLEQDYILDFFDGGLGGQEFRAGGFVITNAGEHDQLSAEVKYSASYFDGAVDLVSGLFYFTEDNITDFADLFTINVGTAEEPVGLQLNLADRVLENELVSLGAYSQADWRATDRLTFTLGARWTEEVKEIEFTDNAGPDGPLNSANLVAAGIPLEQTKALITPRFAVQYDVLDDISVFASYTEGFKSGGWNARSTRAETITPFKRELAKSYEAGLRSLLFNNAVRFNLTAFFLEVEDLQSPSAFTRSDGGVEFLTQNFSDLENMGLEVDFSWAVTDALNLDGSLGLQDAEYTNPGEPILAQQADCIASPDNAGGGQGIVAPDCSLSEPVRVPEITLSLGGSYALALPSLGATLTPSANVRYVSETFTGTSNQPNSEEDGYTLVNAGATLDFDDANWRLTLECRNCTDEAYITSNLAGTVYYNDPRRIALRLRYGF